MIILDTNVLSAMMRAGVDAAVATWLDTLPRDAIWTTSVTVFEIRLGIELLPEGRRRSQLQTAFVDLLEAGLNGRVLAFDTGAAEAAGRIAAMHRRAGRSADIRDAQIAGVAIAYNATLATRNIRHFEGIGLMLVDPWST